MPRGAGVLFHVTSLPGGMGIGDLGPPAGRFLAFLRRAGQTYWQILPVGPTEPAFGNSPYTSYSAFAGNPLLISPEVLVRDGLLTASDVEDQDSIGEGTIAYDAVIRTKMPLIERAADRLLQQGGDDAFSSFGRRNRHWLEDYALFTALKRRYGMRVWTDWPDELKRREPDALSAWLGRHGREVERERAIQYLFFRQWAGLRRMARDAGVHLLGDLPIYVSFDSADAWAHPGFFDLDPDTLLPRTVAGVPPDYFSETGQRWGNPLYRWTDAAGRLRDDLGAWWAARIRHLLELVDLVRIDHFRGLEAFWEIPAREETAVNGRWVPGPGGIFLRFLKGKLGGLPLVAEDLGVITPEVEALRDDFGLPGMKVLQFAFDAGDDNPYLPENYGDGHCLAYTGTHDNDTTTGWTAGLDGETRSRVCRYLDCAPAAVTSAMIRKLYGSTARCVIVPIQDHLGLSSEARLNTPGKAGGNWIWRCRAEDLNETLADRMRTLCQEGDRGGR